MEQIYTDEISLETGLGWTGIQPRFSPTPPAQVTMLMACWHVPKRYHIAPRGLLEAITDYRGYLPGKGEDYDLKGGPLLF